MCPAEQQREIATETPQAERSTKHPLERYLQYKLPPAFYCKADDNQREPAR